MNYILEFDKMKKLIIIQNIFILLIILVTISILAKTKINIIIAVTVVFLLKIALYFIKLKANNLKIYINIIITIALFIYTAYIYLFSYSFLFFLPVFILFDGVINIRNQNQYETNPKLKSLLFLILAIDICLLYLLCISIENLISWLKI